MTIDVVYVCLEDHLDRVIRGLHVAQVWLPIVVLGESNIRHEGAPFHYFFVDHLDDRFWSFHTQSSSAVAFRFLRERVEGRRDLDWAWLPSAHLRHVWPGSTPHWLRSDFRGGRLLPDERVQDLQVEVRGRDADALVDHIRAREGYAGAIAFDRVASPRSSRTMASSVKA